MILAPRPVPMGPPKFLSQHEKEREVHKAPAAEAKTKEPTSA
jgi:hypothetical protein